jgi:hypothetical protein
MKEKMNTIPKNSRTKNEIFKAWKLTDDSKDRRFTEYWHEQLNDCVDFYEKMGFKLLCCGWNNKIPVRGVHWAERELTYENALTLLKKRMNIAVNLNHSGLITAELDEEAIPYAFDKLRPYFFRTLSVKSPHGYHLHFHYDRIFSKKTLDKLDDAFGVEALFRGGSYNQFALVPLSCVDGRVYEFINKTSDLMPFSRLVKEVLSNRRN